jgi:sodium/proline symporter
MKLVSFAWAGLGSTFAASIVLSLFWKKCTRNGIVVGMIAGALTAIVWRFLGWSEFLYEILPGVMVSGVAVFVVSVLDKPPAAEILREFEKVRLLVREKK